MAMGDQAAVYHALLGAAKSYLSYKEGLLRDLKREEKSRGFLHEPKDKLPGLRNATETTSKINDLYYQQGKLNREISKSYANKYESFILRAESHFGVKETKLIKENLTDLVNSLAAVGAPENIERQIKRMNLFNMGICWLTGVMGFNYWNNSAPDQTILKVNRAIHDIESKIQDLSSQNASQSIRDRISTFIQQEFKTEIAQVYESISHADVFDPALKVKQFILNVFGGRKRVKEINKDILRNLRKTAEANKMPIALALVTFVTTGKLDLEKLIKPWKQMGASVFKKYESDLKNLTNQASNAIPQEFQKYCSVDAAKDEANKTLSEAKEQIGKIFSDKALSDLTAKLAK